MLKAISLFTGVGGLDFGLEAAGFRSAVTVEMDAHCCKTIKLNRRWPLLEGDIHEISSRAILRAGGLRKGQADLLVAGPPCQPFSKSSYWVSGDALRLDDPRSDTLTAYLRVLRDTKPKAFLLENVSGIAFKEKSEGMELLLRGIDQINSEAGTNYSAQYAVLNAASYGVPQTRERVFLIGSRNGAQFNFPTTTHGKNASPLLPSSLESYRTAWDALGGLPSPTELDSTLTVGGRWGGLLPSIPEGQNYLWHTPRGGGLPLFGWRTRYWSFLLKLSKSRPSWTIQARPGPHIGPFHWENRRLTAAEMCRLQTFPDIRFDSPHSEIQKMLGNAVPSLLTEILGLEIRRQLLLAPRRSKKLKLLPPRCTLIPPSEVTHPVPERYWPLAGDHPDHPGEGQGRAARARAQASASPQSPLF